MKLSCPECHTTQTLKKSETSQTVACPSCGVTFLIPTNVLTEIRRLKNSIRKEKKQLKEGLQKEQKQLFDVYKSKRAALAQNEKKERAKYHQQADPQSVGTLHVGLTDSIGLILLKMVFGLYCIVTIALTLFHMALEYKTVENGIHKDLVNIQKGFAPSLSAAVWNLDNHQLNAILKGMLQMPAALGGKVLSPNGELIIASGLIVDENQAVKQSFYDDDGEFQVEAPDRPILRMITFQGPIVFWEDGEANDLGTITLYSSSDVVLDKVGFVFLSIILIAVGKTLALWGLFLWFSRRLLTRPLSRLTQAATRFDLNKLDVPEIDLQTKGRNELKILQESFSEMWAKLVAERKQNNQMMATFEKFVPKQFLAKLAKGGLGTIPLGLLESDYHPTLLFSHLSSKTSLLSLEGKAFFQFINTYIDFMLDSIETNGGFVDRFYHSAIIASFELDTPTTEAVYAIYAAIGMQRKLPFFYEAYPQHWK